jgi:hypothetical protein
MANLIAENLYAQVDTEGRQYQVMDEITDKYSNQHRRKTANGWELLI